jgi:hypothetical protein
VVVHRWLRQSLQIAKFRIDSEKHGFAAGRDRQVGSSSAAASAQVAGSPFAIVPSAAAGTGLANYTISYVNGKLKVDPALLAITASDRTKTYGDAVTLAETEFTTAGLVSGDSVTSVTLASTGAVATAQVACSPYHIVASAAVGRGWLTTRSATSTAR